MSDTPFSLVTDAPEHTQALATGSAPANAPAPLGPLGIQPLLAPLEAPQRLGGASSFDNISPRCRCHNLLAAEADFGREGMQEVRERQPHESPARQAASTRRERSD
jgi:hypothetical protein